ncbi:MAG: hypothetical protein Ct9H300mP3_04420 [Gammaproteobacteria bacterium]|nr:MAG: hypothetical protein Ct9H300mP3_04420 [Gammaproteobacteria bacterium]
MNPNLSDQEYCKKIGIPTGEKYVAMYCEKQV